MDSAGNGHFKWSKAMSNNDRLQENNKGTMGTLFRRMTMASLGLDAMEDVSEQSFDVIDRADTFAERLLGGVTRMMPRDSFERIGIATSSDALWKEVYSGIVSPDGPKNATDVGEWQYWLDAVLLTLFDEEEEEAEVLSGRSQSSSRAATSSSTSSSIAAANAKRQEIERKKQEIRERVAQLNASGVKPSMLRQLSVSKQREIAKASGLAEKMSSRANVVMTAEEAERAGIKVVVDPSTGKAMMTVAEAEKAGIKLAKDARGRMVPEAMLNVVTEPTTGKVLMTVLEAERAGIKIVKDSSGRMVPEALLASSDKMPTQTEQKLIETAIRNSEVVRVLSASQTGMSNLSVSGISSNGRSIAGSMSGYESVISDFANALIKASTEAVSVQNRSVGGARVSGMDIFATSSNQVLASHVLERAKRLEAAGLSNGAGAQSAEAAKLLGTWRENVERFSRSTHQDGNDVVALHEMQRLVREMSAKGLVTQAIADQFRTSSRTFAARSLETVLSQDQTKAGSALISRIENGIQAMMAHQGADMLVSSKAVTSESPVSIRAAKVGHAEHLLATSFENFSQAVRSYVDRSGNNAATMRFERASERYEQLAGLSEEQDRVLLRDLVESAAQLESTGVIPRGTVSRLVRNATQEAERHSSLSSSMREQVQLLQGISSGADKLVTTLSATRNEKLGRQFSRLMSNVDQSLNTLVSGLKEAGIQSSVIEPLVRDITQIKADAVEASVEENVNRVEMLSHSLDSFVERALGSLPEQGFGYEDLDTDRAFVSPESSVASSEEHSYGSAARRLSSVRGSLAAEPTKIAAQLEEVRQYVASVTKLQREAEEKFTALIQDKVLNEARVSSEIRSEIARAVESHNIEQLIAAQKTVASKLAESVNAKVNAQIEAASKQIEASRSHFEAVSKQIREIERAAEISRMLHVARDQAYIQNIVKASSNQSVQLTSPLRSLQSSVSIGGSRIENSYLPALNEAIQSYAKLREEYARFDTPSLANLRIEETTQRIDRMMTLLQTSEQQAQEAAKNALVSRIMASRNVGASSSASESSSVSGTASARMSHEALSRVTEQFNRMMSSASDPVTSRYIAMARNAAFAQAMGVEMASSESFESLLSAISSGKGMEMSSVVPFGAGNELLGQQFGYEEIVPDTFDKVKSEGSMRGYASVDSISSYAPMLGSRKALELHADGLLRGNFAEAGAFKTALGNVLSSQSTVSSEPVSWYTVNEMGERVRMTVANGQRPSEGYALRSPIGESYQPAALRGQAMVERAITPVIDIQKLDSVESIGGAEQFVPVMLGGAVSEKAGMGDAAVSASMFGEGLASANAARTSEMGGVSAHGMEGENIFVNGGAVSGANGYASTPMSERNYAGSRQFASSEGANSVDRAMSGARFGMSGLIGKGFVSGEELATTAENAALYLSAKSYFDTSLNGYDRYEGLSSDGFDGERRLLNVSLGGTNVAMTPEAYVQAIAEPQISSSARSLSFGSDALYESFASVLSQQGSSRSLGSLRRTFFEKLSAAGRSTARGWIGLNSQSFASLLGIEANDAASSHATFAGYDAQRGEFLKSDSSVQGLAGVADNSVDSISNPSVSFGSVSYESGSSSAYADMSNGYMRSYVSGSQNGASSSSFARGMNAVSGDSYGMQLLRASSSNSNASSSERQHSGELLGHIDSLLDYVEDVSNRNVGVFSTNEVVRVLVEQLPRESYLGEKGLPKWRQKDIRARQVEEARELREALKKIGASPIQGMQRINDKNFVSPNLIPQTTAAAPLFSGGSDGGSTPTTASSLSGANSNSLDQGNIPEGDLEIIAEEVYEMILESLNEELQRRRSE